MCESNLDLIYYRLNRTCKRLFQLFTPHFTPYRTICYVYRYRNIGLSVLHTHSNFKQIRLLS